MSQRGKKTAAASKSKKAAPVVEEEEEEVMDVEEEQEETITPKKKSSTKAKRTAKKKEAAAASSAGEDEGEEGEEEEEQEVKKTKAKTASSKKKAPAASKKATKKAKEAGSDEMDEEEREEEAETSPSQKEKAEPQGGKKRKRQEKAKPTDDEAEADDAAMTKKEAPATPKKGTTKGKKATPAASRRRSARKVVAEEESENDGSDESDDEDTAKGSKGRRALKPSLYEEFQALNEGTKKLGKLRERRGAATRRIKPEEEVPDSTLTFLNDLKPKYGANEFVAVNPETDEEEFYLAQLREDVFAKVQSVVHVLWLEPVEEDDKSVWEFEEFDTIPCGSIICRVALKDGGKDNETMLLSEAERQRILERKALDSEEEEAAAKKEEEEAAATAAAQKKKKKPAKGKKKSADDAEAEAEENGDEDDGENEDDGEGEDGEKKKGGKKKPVLKKALSRPQIVKEEEEQDKLLERLEKIEDPTFAPGKAVKANAHRGARVQAAKRSTARRIGAGAGRSSGGRSRSGSSAKPRSRKRKTAEDDDDDDDGEDTKRPAKRARTTRRRGKRVGELDKTVKKVTSDPTFDEADGELRNKCCTLCSSREAIRAVLANDMPLLKKVIADNDFVHSLFVPRSASEELTCLEYAVKTNNIDALKLIVEAIKNLNQLKRAKPTQISLKTMGSGDYNFHTFGHAVRKVAASRGGKEGNNAFASDTHQYQNNTYVDTEAMVRVLMQSPEVKKETIDWLILNYPDFESAVSNYIYLAAYAGNRKLAGFFVEWFESRGGYGFNFLHKQALLNDGKAFDQYKIQSVGKKPIGNNTMTPFHCAAINPNVKYLKELLSAKSEDRLPDSIKRQPIHYAAACTGPDPLKFLLERGISHTEVDMELTTPLMIAAQWGRLDNVKLLLEWEQKKNEEMEKGKENDEDDEKGSDAEEEEEEEAPRKKPKAKAVAYIDCKAKGTHYTALHLAVRQNQVEAVKLLIEKGANIECPDAMKMTPLHHAVVLGHLDIVKVLVEEGPCNIEAADKLKRTAVIHAVRNGQLVVLGYLLRMSADACCADSSNNTAAHYAAAFGWLECLKLLIERGADPNAPNDWKTTPLGIAMQKGHMAIADYLLEQDSVDVNIRDDDGKTLVAQMMEVITDSTLKQLNYLLEKKDADVTTADAQGYTPLHHLAKNYDPRKDINDNSNNNDDDDDNSSDEEDDEENEEDEDAMEEDEEEEEEEDEDEEESGRSRKKKAAPRKKSAAKGKEKADKEPSGDKPAAKPKKKNWSVEIAKVLIKKGADVNAITTEKESPFLFAMQHYNEELIALLLEHGAQATSAFDKNSGQNILHQLTPHLMKTNVMPLIELIAKSSAEQFKVMANEVDHEGFTPFLRFIQHYASWVPANLTHLRGGARTKQTARKVWGGHAPRKVATRFGHTPHHHQQHQARDDASLTPQERLQLEQLAREKFRQFLEHFIELGGVNPALPVQRTKEWKDYVEKRKKDAKEKAEAAGAEDKSETSLLAEAADELAAEAEDPMEQDPPTQKKKRREITSDDDEDEEDEDEEDDEDEDEESDDGGWSRNKKSRPAKKSRGGDGGDDNANKPPPPYSAGVGLRTALHFLVGQKDTELVKLLLDKYHLDVNAQDFDGKDTPLLLTITNSRSEMLSILLAHKAINVNLANRFGASPLHQAVANLNILFVKSLLDKKANVDVRDKNERTPLHYALQRKHMDLVQALVAAGADVNAVDDNGRNGLHYAVNAADSGADASFEMEDFLLSHGAEVNQRDKHGRVPMHYAFVKIGQDVASQTSSIDPIETISSLCALDQLEIDPADHHGCTPLHYAAQRGATTCSLLLLNRKAALEHEDRDGNTPLGVAIKSGHGDYAIMLLQKKADVRHPIHYVTREWRQREGATDPKDKVEVETGRYFRSMFYVAVVNGWQGVSYMMLDAGLDKLTALIDAINTGKFQLVVTLLSKTKRDEVVQGVDAHGRTLFHHLANYAQGNLDVKWATTLAEKLLARKVSMVALDKHGRLPLHYAARRGYYDLVWFFVTRHVDPSLVDKKGKSPLVYATEGSVNIQNLRIASVLMSGTAAKKADPNILYPNPVHQAARKAIEAKKAKMDAKAKAKSKATSDAEGKIKAATDALAKIAEKTRPIIHAAKDNLPAFVTALLSRTAGRLACDVNAQDSLGKTALMYAICNNDVDMVQHLFTAQEPLKVNVAAAAPSQPTFSPFGAQFGSMPHAGFGGAFGGFGIAPAAAAPKPATANKGKGKGKAKDDELEVTPLANKTKINPNVQDANGKTALHYVVSPLDFGSYENVKLLALLVKSGADVNIKDKQGHTALYYAMQQRDGVMAKALQKLGAKLDKKETLLSRQESFVHAEKWISDFGIPPVDWEHDAAELLKNPPPPTAEELKKAEEEKREAHPVDREFDLWETSEVHAVAEDEVYDVTLTKVDVQRGLYGVNNFYRMQVIHNKVKDLYILWNKWGRIGDTGQYQRTPFPSADAACEEFRKIFRSKTGNAWEERAAFDKKPKKYHLVKVDAERERSIANLLKPFDVEIEDDVVEPQQQQQQQPTNKNAGKSDKPKYPASKLPVPLQHAIKALTDSTMLTQAMRTAGIDTDAMPLGRLTKEDIEAAKQILADIRKLLHKIHPPATPASAEEKADEDDEEENEDDEDEENEDEEDEDRPKKKQKKTPATATTGGDKPKELTLDEARVFFEQIAELSNRFYELIPHANYTVESIPPLDNENLLNEKFTMLGNLAEIQTASKILLGAHYRSKELNPLDYCYSAMNIRLNDIEKETDEYKTLMTYIKNTEQGALRGKFITNIYNLQRKGEPERFQKWEDLHNHQLLFHGSHLANFVGILSQGLRIAPPEAPVSGYAFGKGVYFADMFQKSFNYCRMGDDYSYHHRPGKKQKQTGFMLLCEVALGDMNAIKEAAYMEKAPEGTHSTKGIGQRGPDFSKSIVLPSGVGIPVGQVITYPVDPKEQYNHYNYYRLQHNEYIVYDASQVRVRYLIQVSDQDPNRRY